MQWQAIATLAALLAAGGTVGLGLANYRHAVKQENDNRLRAIYTRLMRAILTNNQLLIDKHPRAGSESREFMLETRESEMLIEALASLHAEDHQVVGSLVDAVTIYSEYIRGGDATLDEAMRQTKLIQSLMAKTIYQRGFWQQRPPII